MFQDPKYAIFAVNRATGRPIPPHIPLMLLVAKDAIAADHAVEPYVAACFEHGADEEQVQSARERLQAFRDFAADHPGEMKLPSSVLGGLVGAPADGPSFPIAIDGHHTYWLSGGNVVQFLKPGADGALLAGTTTEEVLQMLIDRVQRQDAIQHSVQNDATLGALRTALNNQQKRMQQARPVLFGVEMTPNTSTTSGNLEAYGYRASDHTLALQFKGGKVYHYAQVPDDVAQQLAQAESPGSFVAQHVVHTYAATRMDTAAARAKPAHA